MDVTDFIKEWDKTHISQPSYQDVIDWTGKKIINKVYEYTKVRYDLDYCENVKDILNYLKSLVEK